MTHATPMHPITDNSWAKPVENEKNSKNHLPYNENSSLRIQLYNCQPAMSEDEIFTPN